MVGREGPSASGAEAESSLPVVLIEAPLPLGEPGNVIFAAAGADVRHEVAAHARRTRSASAPFTTGSAVFGP
jgi:hypothetical protein